MPHIPFRIWVIVVALLLIVGGASVLGTINAERRAVDEAQGVVEGKPMPTRTVLEAIMEQRFFEYGLDKRIGLDPALEGKLGYNVSSIRCAEIYDLVYECHFAVSPYLLTERSFLKSQVVKAKLSYRNKIWLVDLQ